MPDLEARMRADRALRDAARSNLKTDVRHVRADLARQGITSRLFDRAAEGAEDMYEEAVDLAENHKGALATLIAAVFVWFARNPILSLFGLEENGEQDEHADHWSDDDYDYFGD